MHIRSGVILLGLCASIWSVNSAALILHFDDIDASAGDVALESYQGFTWSNFAAYTNAPGFTGFNNGIVSPANAAYSGGESFDPTATPIVGSLTSSAPFDFSGAALGAAYYDNLTVTVEGRRAGDVLFSQNVILNTSGAQAFNFNFAGIDTLTFSGAATAATIDPFSCGVFNCTQFTVDDLRVTPIPLPGAFGLMLAAFCAATGIRVRLKSGESPAGC